ncbi:MAG: hypothetical protein QF593_04690 [Nitrospinota bacterium]|nr:hypothetical protein [Nitrospinota bacterium]
MFEIGKTYKVNVKFNRGGKERILNPQSPSSFMPNRKMENREGIRSDDLEESVLGVARGDCCGKRGGGRSL